MSPPWTSIVFGYPFFAIGSLVAGLGVVRRVWYLVAIGTVLLAPFTVYVGLFPRVLGVPLVALALLVGATIALRIGRTRLAVGLAVGYAVLMTGVLAVLLLLA